MVRTKEVCFRWRYHTNDWNQVAQFFKVFLGRKTVQVTEFVTPDVSTEVRVNRQNRQKREGLTKSRKNLFLSDKMDPLATLPRDWTETCKVSARMRQGRLTRISGYGTEP